MRWIYESFEKHMRTAETHGRHGSDVSHVLGLYPVALLDQALARVTMAKKKIRDDATRTARVTQDEFCLRSTRLFVMAYRAATDYYLTLTETDWQHANHTADQFIDLHQAARVGLPRAARSLMGAPTFSRPGPFSFSDHLDRSSGRSWRAKSLSQFRLGNSGLDLPAKTTGQIIYEFKSVDGLIFEEVSLRAIFRGTLRLEISTDGGATWQEHADLMSGKESTLTSAASGHDRFLLRLTARNDADHDILAIDFLEINGSVVHPKSESPSEDKKHG